MHATEAVKFSNISADTAAFSLLGGVYCQIVNAGAWNAGSVFLQILAIDGTTWVPVSSYTADTYDNWQPLPPGQYRVAVSAATGVYYGIISNPSE